MKKTIKLVSDIAGIIAGLLSVIKSFAVNDKGIGSYVSNSSYGGDAYTGIQNAAAQTANNVQDTNILLRVGLAAILLVLGLAIICYFARKLAEDLDI